MSEISIDRLGRLVTPPPFLAAPGPRDRSVSLILRFIVAGAVAACVAVLVSVLLVTVGAAVVWSRHGGPDPAAAFAVLAGGGHPGRGLLSYVYELLVAGPGSYAAAALLLVLASLVFRRPVRSFLTTAARFRWGVVLAGFAVAFPLVAMAFAVDRLGDPSRLAAPLLTPHTSAGELLGYALAATACLYLAAFAEEAIFRGWLLQQTAAWSRSLPLILAVNGVLFSLAHFDPSPVNFAIRAIMGAGWAWIALRTAGVEFTTGAHLANNLFVALFVAPVKFVAPAAQASGYGPALTEAALMLAIAGVVEIYLRRAPATRAETAAAPAET
jgi:membrane protease YdiL (CAAX protease family)